MVSLTMLNDIMGPDIETAVSRLLALGIDELDLKAEVFGRRIEDLDDSRRERLARLLEQTGTRVHCLSSSLAGEDVTITRERACRERLERGVQNLLETIAYVRPRFVRLLSCGAGGTTEAPIATLERLAPWIFDAYRDAVQALFAAGVLTTIENEPESALSEPSAVPAFFEHLGLPGKVGFTWDVQNMWAAGTFPSIEVYEQMRPVIDYVHLKGGRGSHACPRTLVYRAPLTDAGWPVQEIVGRIIGDGVSDVLCINTSDGVAPDDYQYAAGETAEMWSSEAIDDVRYLRDRFSSIA